MRISMTTNPRKIIKILIVFDDMITGIMSKKNLKP